MSGHCQKKIYFKQKGQALLELAIFGSILMILLGVLVNYGLRYNYQQKAMQHAFRKALYFVANDADPTDIDPLTGRPKRLGSTSYVLVQDKHIPNPSSPFGVGAVMPVSASASVVRDFHMDETPDDTFSGEYRDYPRARIEINGQRFGEYDRSYDPHYKSEQLTVDSNMVLPPGSKALGVQPDYIKETTVYNELDKEETEGASGSTTGGITTRDSTYFGETINRRILYKQMGTNNVDRDDISSEVERGGTKTWTTDWPANQQ